MGYNTRSGEYTRSRYFETLAHKNPRVKGCAGSPLIFVARPSCTVIRTPQASGQSCGHAAWMTCGMKVKLYGAACVERLSNLRTDHGCRLNALLHCLPKCPKERANRRRC